MTREDAINELQYYRRFFLTKRANAIDMAIEALSEPQIIRCKDCKYSHMTYDGDCKYCDKWQDDDDICLTLYVDGEFYCGFAERKEA